MNCARGEAISEGHRRNRSWAREHPGERDEAWFSREIAPKLDAFTLARLRQPRAYRSRPARANGAVPRCRIRGIGSRYSCWPNSSWRPSAPRRKPLCCESCSLSCRSGANNRFCGAIAIVSGPYVVTAGRMPNQGRSDKRPRPRDATTFVYQSHFQGWKS
jgi:hypothetical protein